MKVELTDEAFHLLEDMLGNSDAKTFSQVVIGGYDLMQRLLKKQEKLEKVVEAARVHICDHRCPICKALNELDGEN